MTIRQQGGIFGRNPSFNDVAAETLDISGSASTGPLSVDGTISANIQGSGVAFSLSRLGVDGLSGYLAGTGASIFSNTRCGLFFNNSDILPASGNGGAVTDAVDLGSSSFKFRDLNLSGNVIVASGKGINFSATAGTGTSELFDDYEEGTFTVTDTSGAGLTFTQEHGFYTKVGRLVHCHIFVQYPSTANGSNAKLGGFPFTSASLGASMGGAWGYTNGTGAVSFTIGQGATDIGINNSSGGSLTNANMSGSFNYITVTYQAA